VGKEDIAAVQGIAYREREQLKITAPGPKLDLRELPSHIQFAEDIPELGKRVTYIRVHVPTNNRNRMLLRVHRR